MAKKLFEISGMDQLQAKIKKLGNDKDKRKPVLAILRKSAQSTIKVARQLSPEKTGVGKKSIKFQVLRRARVPMGIVGPRSLGKYDGWYVRQFVIPGHNIYKSGFKRKHRKGANEAGVKNKVAPNFFMSKAQQITKGRVSAEAVSQMQKFIQKQINKI